MFCILPPGSQPARTRVHWIVFALFAALVILQVFVPPPVGIANNGNWGGAPYLGYIAVVRGACLALAWRSRYRAGAMCLVAAPLMAFLIATLGDTVEVARHCFIANTLFDLVVASCAAAMLTKPVRS